MLHPRSAKPGRALIFLALFAIAKHLRKEAILLPAALVGINLQEFMQHAIEAERACSEDAIDNPAISLFRKHGFQEERRTEEKIYLRKEL